MTKNIRIEADSLGQVEVPADMYWGAQTQRSLMNFPFVPEERMPMGIIHALACVKQAAVRVNRNHGLKARLADAIEAAAAEIAAGKERITNLGQIGVVRRVKHTSGLLPVSGGTDLARIPCWFRVSKTGQQIYGNDSRLTTAFLPQTGCHACSLATPGYRLRISTSISSGTHWTKRAAKGFSRTGSRARRSIAPDWSRRWNMRGPVTSLSSGVSTVSAARSPTSSGFT